MDNRAESTKIRLFLNHTSIYYQAYHQISNISLSFELVQLGFNSRTFQDGLVQRQTQRTIRF